MIGWVLEFVFVYGAKKIKKLYTYMDKRNVRNYIHTWIKDNNIYKYEFS